MPPKCPKCDRTMASVMKREGGQVRTYYQCAHCRDENTPKQDQPTSPDEDQKSRRPAHGQDSERRSHP